jgi:hypothetical protein
VAGLAALVGGAVVVRHGKGGGKHMIQPACVLESVVSEAKP